MDKYIEIIRTNNIVRARLLLFNVELDYVETLCIEDINDPEFIQFITSKIDREEIRYLLFDIGDQKLMKSLKDLFDIIGLEKAYIKRVNELDTVVIDVNERDNKYSVSEILFGD